MVLRAGSLEGGLGVAGQPISWRGCIKQVRARRLVQAVLFDGVFCNLYFGSMCDSRSVADFRGSRPWPASSH